MLKRLLSSLLIFTLVISLGLSTFAQEISPHNVTFDRDDPNISYKLTFEPVTQVYKDHGVVDHYYNPRVRFFNWNVRLSGTESINTNKAWVAYYEFLEIQDSIMIDSILSSTFNLPLAGISRPEDVYYSMWVETGYTGYVQIFEIRNHQDFKLEVIDQDGHVINTITGRYNTLDRFVPVYCQKLGEYDPDYKCHDEYPGQLIGPISPNE